MASPVWIFALLTALAGATSAIPQATCIPEGHEDWPVGGIYLHGWFQAAGGGDSRNYRRLEFKNRETLLVLAKKYRMRIALPLGRSVNGGGMRRWEDTSLAQIEADAKRLCGVSTLPEGRFLVGFSNGGFKARDIGFQPCDSLRDYGKILSVGTQQNIRPRCGGQYANVAPHVFPPPDLEGRLGFRAARPPAQEGEDPFLGDFSPLTD